MPIVASDEKAFKFRGRESYQGLVFESAISMLQIFPVFPVLVRASLPFLQRCSLRVLFSLLHQHGVRSKQDLRGPTRSTWEHRGGDIAHRLADLQRRCAISSPSAAVWGRHN